MMESALFVDELAPPEERRWMVTLAEGGGLKIEALNEQLAIVDTMELRRYGPFISIDLEKRTDLKLPPAMAFMRELLDAQAKLTLLGVGKGLWPPVLVRRADIVNLQAELPAGVMPAGKVPIHGSLIFFGQRVVWHEDLERHL
jgi:hypothetical protein